MTLLLIRHGESEGNVAGLLQGQIDHPLTARGHEQARAVAARLKGEGGVDRIVSSPLARAHATAEAIGGALGLSVTADARLMEYDFGEISGLAITEALARYPGWRFWSDAEAASPAPGEEGLAAFDARVAQVLDELLALAGRTIAVTHGGVIMSALNAAVGVYGPAGDGYHRARFRTTNCAITELARDGEGRLVVRRHNDACHLPADSGASPAAGSGSSVTAQR